MKALLDTCAFLWFIGGSERLSGTARSFIEDFDNKLCMSAASFWEIAVKVNIGKLELARPFDRLIIAQAICGKLPVISYDRAFPAYPIELIW